MRPSEDKSPECRLNLKRAHLGPLAPAVLCLGAATVCLLVACGQEARSAGETTKASPTARVTAAALAEFMAEWQDYVPFVYPSGPEDEPLLLAALQKDPAGIWWGYLNTRFSELRGEARCLTGAGRAARYRAALAYLRPARDILRRACERNPESTTLNGSLDQAQGALAFALLEASVDLGDVRTIAQGMLAGNSNTQSWYYGNVIYEAHTLLGRAALREGNLDEAKQHLLAAGQTPGSPQLNSFGPDFRLARELVENGERGAVVEFLTLVARFWKGRQKTIENWQALISTGKAPEDPEWTGAPAPTKPQSKAFTMSQRNWADAPIAPAELDAFMKRMTGPSSYHPLQPEELPLVLAALQKDPSGPWGFTMWLMIQNAMIEVCQLPVEERAAAYQATLVWLKPVRDTVARLVQGNPEDGNLRRLLGQLQQRVMHASFEAGEDIGQIKTAAEALLVPSAGTGAPNPDDLVAARMILGRIAVREGKLDVAGQHLLASAHVTGLQTIPELSLARELLAQGARDAVSEYLTAVSRVLPKPQPADGYETRAHKQALQTMIERWKRQIANGKVPADAFWLRNY